MFTFRKRILTFVMVATAPCYTAPHPSPRATIMTSPNSHVSFLAFLALVVTLGCLSSFTAVTLITAVHCGTSQDLPRCASSALSSTN